MYNRQTTTDPQRRAAAWVIGKGGAVAFYGQDNDPTQLINKLSDIPKEGQFVLNSVKLDTQIEIRDGDLEMLHDVPSLGSLAVSGPLISNQALNHIVRHKSLNALYLPDTQINDKGLERLIDLPRLNRLNLRRMKFTDLGMVEIAKCSTLTHLDLTQCEGVSDQGILALKILTNLNYLGVEKTKVTAKGIQELQKHLPNCTILWDGSKKKPKAGATTAPSPPPVQKTPK